MNKLLNIIIVLILFFIFADVNFLIGKENVAKFDSCDKFTEENAKAIAEIGNKKVTEYPLTPWGYDVGEVISLENFAIREKDDKGASIRVRLRPYSKKQIYNIQWGGFLVTLQGEDESVPYITAPIRTTYECPIISSKVAAEDYDSYVVIAEVKSAEIGKEEFDKKNYPVHKINIKGKDSTVGDRRFIMLLQMVERNMSPLVPIGLLPGTRIIIPSNVSINITGKEKGRTVKYIISNGAIDVRLDKTIRLENATKLQRKE